MPARVFISCGQASPEERLVAQNVSAWLSSQGFRPYVAVNVQTIPDLNSGIIGSLRDSDYYLFIDFPREPLNATGEYRGSLYTHQELAAAYILNLSPMILISHERVKNEGIKKFIVSNSPAFKTADEVPHLVQEAVSAAGWTPAFSRHMSVTLRLENPCRYFDHTTGPQGRQTRVLHGDVRNHRNDLPAKDTICRLAAITDAAGQRQSPDTNLLKASGRNGYEHTIWPNSTCPFDLLRLDLSSPPHIYLHSSLDFVPRSPIVTSTGTVIFHYELLSEGFPLLPFSVEIVNTGNHLTTTIQIC